jgi:hypothetical protein
MEQDKNRVEKFQARLNRIEYSQRISNPNCNLLLYTITGFLSSPILLYFSIWWGSSRISPIRDGDRDGPPIHFQKNPKMAGARKENAKLTASCPFSAVLPVPFSRSLCYNQVKILEYCEGHRFDALSSHTLFRR